MLRLAICCVVALLLLAQPQPQAHAEPLRGVNLGAAGFAPEKIPGAHGVHYLWPTQNDVELYAQMGATVLRIPFLWERMQPVLMGELDAVELARLDEVVAAAAIRHIFVVLDIHNYGRYGGKLVGDQAVPSSSFENVWLRLAEHYKDQPYIIFGLMNEPQQDNSRVWASLAQAALNAIRSTGARQLVLVPGIGWTGAHNWTKGGASSNATAMEAIKDPASHMAYEMHLYFDDNSSGTKSSCVSHDIGVQRLEAATTWLRQKNKKGFLAEFGASKDPVCLQVLSATLDYLHANADVWDGWTYWAAARWFGSYMFNIYPPDPALYPQVKLLQRAMML